MDGKNLVEVKTAELIGPALDWAVALATGARDLRIGAEGTICCIYQLPEGGCWTNLYEPSTSWSQGGPLIDKYLIDFTVEHKTMIVAALCDENGMHTHEEYAFGSTYLIAACRAIVDAKLGDVVQVPAELVSP